MSTASPVSPEIEIALPDDAPAGHVSHEKVKISLKGGTALVQMKVKQPDGESVAFQVTMQALGENGSDYALARIARACWVLLESGASKDKVLQFRSDCYKKVASVNTQSKPLPEQKKTNGGLVSKSEASPEVGLGSAGDSENRSNEATPASAEVTDVARSPVDDIGDAPEGHEAWNKVKMRMNPVTGVPNFQFHFQNALGEKIAFQTTTTAAGGSEDMAQRIARLCYIRFSEGHDKAGVTAYRDELYAKLRGAKPSPQIRLGSAADSKKSSSAATEPAALPLAESTPASAKVTESARLPIDDIGDAPEGHEAWDKIQTGFRTGTTIPEYRFNFKNALGERVAFQTTVLASGGSEQMAQRIARLCYIRFTQGYDKSNVIAYRDELYSKAKASPHIRLSSAVGSKKTSNADTEPATLPLGDTNRASAEVTDSALLPVVDIGDALEGHEAWQQIRTKSNGDKDPVFRFHFQKSPGEKIAFQTTLLAAGGSHEMAQRVARLCYVRFTEGYDKASVTTYRDELYFKLNGGRPPPKKRHAPGSEKTSRKRLRAAGEQKVRKLLIEGRAAGSKNESINGVYVLQSNLPEGLIAYKKLKSEDAPRFLIYSDAKERWRISPALDAEKTSFAYIMASDGGASPPLSTASGPSWQVFSGKDEGYSIDPDVRCLPFNGEDIPESQDSYSYSSSDSESAHSEPSAPAKAAPAKAAPRQRGFAKMLVRSGLRCACHFTYVRYCPDYIPPPESPEPTEPT